MYIDEKKKSYKKYLKFNLQKKRILIVLQN